MASPGAPLFGLRLQITHWPLPVECNLCSRSIPPGVLGVYGERCAEPLPVGETDGYDEVYTWHVACAAAFRDGLSAAVEECRRLAAQAGEAPAQSPWIEVSRRYGDAPGGADGVA